MDVSWFKVIRLPAIIRGCCFATLSAWVQSEDSVAQTIITLLGPLSMILFVSVFIRSKESLPEETPLLSGTIRSSIAGK